MNRSRPLFIVCPRCGIHRQVHTGREANLCRSCRLVTADLDELEVWDE